ncbi:hypothetical protein RCL1_002561 [Eukaryota sp. TZLM3-RCL]
MSLLTSLSLLLNYLHRIGLVLSITFGFFFLVLFFDAIFRYLRNRFSPLKYFHKGFILRCLRTSFISCLILSISLVTAAIRRSFTDASGFTISQSLWHSLASIINIALTLFVNKYVAGNCLHELYWPRSKLGWLSVSNEPKARVIRRRGSSWFVKVTTVLLITIGTHAITPLVYMYANCFGEFSRVPFISHGGVLRFFIFAFTQQLWLLLNAIDEETSWRGVVRAVFEKENKNSTSFLGHSTWTMYLISGLVYALCHSLNATWDDVTLYFIMIINLTVEGAVWMYLFRSSNDLSINWINHHVDDLFSIWFGTSSLASYDLSEGQIYTWSVGNCNQYISGKDFGTGGSLLYGFQNFWTFIVIFVLKKSFFRNRHGATVGVVNSSLLDEKNGPFYFS